MATRRNLAQHDELVERVKLALSEADGAGRLANEKYLQTIAPRHPDGSLAPTNSGFAGLYVSKLKPRLRKVLLELGEIEDSYRGAWQMEKAMDRMWAYQVDHQSACANTMICDAVASLLNKWLGDLGCFYTDFHDN